MEDRWVLNIRQVLSTIISLLPKYENAEGDNTFSRTRKHSIFVRQRYRTLAHTEVRNQFLYMTTGRDNPTAVAVDIERQNAVHSCRRWRGDAVIG